MTHRVAIPAWRRDLTGRRLVPQGSDLRPGPDTLLNLPFAHKRAAP